MAGRQSVPLHGLSNDHRDRARRRRRNARACCRGGEESVTAAAAVKRSAIRLDGLEKVTGTAQYTMDLELPGMLHAKVLRSPHAHARIRSIDARRAAALPGVVCIVSGADAAELSDPTYGVGIRDQPVIAIDKVRYVGDMVAAVAARDEATALRALELIDVEYEP